MPTRMMWRGRAGGRLELCVGTSAASRRRACRGQGARPTTPGALARFVCAQGIGSSPEVRRAFFNRDRARRIGVDEKSIPKLVRRLGIVERQASASRAELFPATAADPNLYAPTAIVDEGVPETAGPTADPNLSTPAMIVDVAPSFHDDPAGRSLDQLVACLGLLDDAAPMFRQGTPVSRGRRAAGVADDREERCHRDCA